MGRADYYDNDARFLGSVGFGWPITRRLIDAAVFRQIALNNMPSPGQFLTMQVPGGGLETTGFGMAPPSVPAMSFERQLLNSSKELLIQQNPASVIATLVADAQRTRKEQGAYIVLQYSKNRLFYSRAAPTASSETDFSFSIARHGNLRLVPTDHTLQIIGTVHTHYADVAAMNAANRNVRHSIAPQVSELDQNSAKTEKIVVYAVDANYVHKALPNGQVRNKLSRQLDILIDALESFGKS